MGDTVRTDPVDEFMLGVRAGQRSMAAHVLDARIADEDLIRRRICRALLVARRQHRQDLVLACIAVAVVTAIAVYNLTLHGVTL